MKVRVINEIYYSSRFKKRLQRLPKQIQEKAVHCEGIFRQNCFDARLQTHKLKGKHKNYWSFSVSYLYRIIFRFIDDHSVLFIDVGTHRIYQ